MRILKLLFLISSLLAGLNSIAQVNLPTMEVKATPMAWSMPIRIYAWAFEDGDLGDPGGNIGGFPDQYYAIPAPENCVGNPVILETGRKTEQEVDFESQGEMGLGLTRTYLNVFDNPNVLNMFGNGWKSQYENTLSTVATNNGAFLFISRPSGEVKRFKRVIINGRPTTTGKLYEEEGPEAIEYVTWVSNGVSINGILYPVYKYFVSDGSVETYWINGQMLSRYKNGIGWESTIVVIA